MSMISMALAKSMYASPYWHLYYTVWGDVVRRWAGSNQPDAQSAYISVQAALEEMAAATMIAGA